MDDGSSATFLSLTIELFVGYMNAGVAFPLGAFESAVSYIRAFAFSFSVWFKSECRYYEGPPKTASNSETSSWSRTVVYLRVTPFETAFLAPVGWAAGFFFYAELPSYPELRRRQKLPALF